MSKAITKAGYRYNIESPPLPAPWLLKRELGPGSARAFAVVEQQVSVALRPSRALDEVEVELWPQRFAIAEHFNVVGSFYLTGQLFGQVLPQLGHLVEREERGKSTS